MEPNGRQRYGYYLPLARSRHGDAELAAESEAAWRELGLRNAGHFDGVSIEQREGRSLVRVVLMNFFDPKQPAYSVHLTERRTKSPS